MVNELIPHSPKRQDDSNDEDCSPEKIAVGESSDEDTTTSSLLPIPDTLDEMRNELKSTINNLCLTDREESPKLKEFDLNDFELNSKHPTEREISIAQKLTSANLLLDDLLASQKNDKARLHPLALAAKKHFDFHSNHYHRTNDAGSETPTTEIHSVSTGRSSECCKSITVTPFVMHNPKCEHSCCPCERKEFSELQNPPPEVAQNIAMYGDVNRNAPIDMKRIQECSNRVKKKRSFMEMLRSMRVKRRKKRRRLVNEGQQTEKPSINTAETRLEGRDNYAKKSHSFHSYAVTRKPSSHRFVHDMRYLYPERMLLLSTSDCSEKELPKEKIETVDKPTTWEPQYKEEEVQTNPLSPQPPLRTKQFHSAKYVRPGEAKYKGIQDRIDVYYFDHGNSAYYRTTDNHPARYTEHIIERTDEYATRFWSELFGTVTIAITFVISFVLQLYRWFFTAIVRGLIVGLIQIFSDYCLKPLLSVVFNGLIQPCLILGYNIATSLKDFCTPFCQTCEFGAKNLAIILSSCRLVQLNNVKNSPTGASSCCHCKEGV